MMDRSTTTAVIRSFLEGLPHTGKAGFEGLVSMLCSAATGQRFRISSSGAQEGQDAQTEPGYGNRIKVEAKHYSKAKLDLRELTAELLQAATADPNLELWILAASCAVPDQHATGLEQVAAKLGVEVIFLDNGTDDLPRLAVLMAAYPEQVGDWIENLSPSSKSSALETALSTLASLPLYSVSLEQALKKLRGTLLGYDDARRRSNGNLLRAISDHGNALAAFNQDAAVRALDAHVITRTAMNDALAAWWNKTNQPFPRAVVLGEEGTGKTWAVFDWVVSHLEADVLPIVLPFSADTEPISTNDSLITILPKLLRKWVGFGSEELWASRLEKWVALPDSSPILLIIADGLNERPSFAWPSFFRGLEDERWRKKIAILVTDRPGHWRPSCAKLGLINFTELQVKGYTDAELALALKGKNISVEEIPVDLQPLIRTPRYCDLVAKHFDEMRAEADFTVERLILIDARARAERKRGPLTEDAFVEIIRNLAIRYRQSPVLNLSDIQHLLPVADPEGRIHQEIIDGGLLSVRLGFPTRYTVEPRRLVFGLGMLLAEDLRAAAAENPDRAFLENEIARWFEPEPSIDLKVEVAGAGLFHSFVQENYPKSARRALLRHWLGLRNWGDRAQLAFVDYVLRSPDDFISLAEEVWPVAQNRGAARELLALALTKHRDDPRVAPALVKAVLRWMSFIHPAGPTWLRPDVDQEKKARKEIESRLGKTLLPGENIICGEPLICTEEDGVLELSRLAFLIISAGSREPFIPAIVRWAVRSAVMGHTQEADIADWVVRLSDEPIEPLLEVALDRLQTEGSQVAKAAAQTLRWRVAPAEARRIREEQSNSENDQWALWKRQHSTDPCTSLFDWSDQDCAQCMQREDLSPRFILQKLEDRVFDPGFELPESLVSRTALEILALDASTFRKGIWATVETHTFDTNSNLLARGRPDVIAEFVHRVVATAESRDNDGLYGLVLWLPAYSPLLNDQDVKILLRASKALYPSLSEQHKPRIKELDPHATEAFIVSSVASHLSSDKLFELLLQRPNDAFDMLRLEPWFRPLSHERARLALDSLQSPLDDVTTARTLWLLAQGALLNDNDRKCILLLADSKSPRVKGAALRFALLVEDDDLGREIVELGDSYREHPESSAKFWGPKVVARYSSHLEFGNVASRLDPVAAGFALYYRNFPPKEVDLYAEILDACTRHIVSAPEPDVEKLPVVQGNPEVRIQGQFPNFDEEATRTGVGPNRVVLTPLPSDDILKQLFEDTSQRVEDINRNLRERADAVISAWDTEALQWFGKSFCEEALGQVLQIRPDIVESWINRAFGRESISQVLPVRLGSLLSQICHLVLEQQPSLGLKLWRTLRNGNTLPIHFDAQLAAIQAADSPSSEEARWEALSDCHDDASLARIGYLCERYKKTAWLRSSTNSLIAASPNWKKALGLTLASFSNLRMDEFEALILEARIGSSWLTEQLDTLRRNIKRNEFARYWYKSFLQADNDVVSWGALHLMKKCADERFFTWRENFETEIDSKQRRRLSYLESDFELRRDLDRQKERRKHLFGIKVERVDVFPFVRN